MKAIEASADKSAVNQSIAVVFDEPTGDLDSATGREIMDLFRALNREENVTILVATHDPLVAGLSSRVIRFRDGRVEGDAPGTPA